jgi:O-antigen ligase
MRHDILRSARFKPVHAIMYFHRFQGSHSYTHDLKDTSLNLLTNTKILLFLAFLALFRLTVLIRRRSDNSFDIIDTYAAFDILITGLTVLFLIFNRNLNRSVTDIIQKSAGIFLLYYLLCVFSSLWSPLPEYSFFRSIQIISQLLVIFIAIYENRSFINAEKFVLRTIIILISIDIIGSLFRSNFNFSTILLHTNSYSNSAAMLCSYCLNEYFIGYNKRRRMLRNYGIVSLILTLVGTSATSNIALVCGLFFTGIFSRNTKYRFVLILITIFFIAFGLASQTTLRLVSHQILLAGKDPDRVRTLTGRIPMWEYYFERAQEKPISGHGFAIATRIGGFYATTTHNFLLSVFLDLGVLGLLIVLWAVCRVISEMKQAGQNGAMGRTGLIGVFITAFVACQSAPFVAVVWSAPSAVFGLLLALHAYYGVEGATSPHHTPHRTALRPKATLMNRAQRKNREFIKRSRYLQYRRWPSR